MRWTRGTRSRNLEDRRGTRAGGGFRMGGGGGASVGVGGLAVLLVLSLVFGRDLVSGFVGGAPAVTSESAGGAIADPAEEEMVLFVSSVLDSTQQNWHRLLPGYTDAKLVLFRDAVESACGFAQAATGPFYCPADHRVYIDLGFFAQLEQQLGAPGDFAQAYVIAHEIGHHVQNVTGIERQVRAAQQNNPRMANQLSVAMELQADCYAGVWAHAAAQGDQLEAGDFEEGLRGASAVGDDRLQTMGGGRVNPETFTHGSSEERRTWFRRGFDSGDPKQCDTFSG